jgi:type I restriction enzyme S subunit
MTNIQSKVPLLRFPEYKGNWKRIELGNIGSFLNGLTYSPDNIRGKGLLVLRSSNVQGGRLAFKDNVFVNVEVKEELLSKLGDILICVRNGSKKLIGKNALITEECPKATHGAFMSVFRSEDSSFAFQLLQTEKYRRQVFVDLGATINSINGSNLKKYKFYSPKSREAEEIATFLSIVDKKISLLKQKHEQLVQYKKGMMQKLFSQQLRFKYDNGRDFPDWTQVHLEDIATPIKRKAEKAIENVMTISAGKGFLHQKERFSQVIAGTSLDKYTLIKEGEFSYNRGNSKSYTYGCIYKLSGDKEALVPFIYRSFKLNKGVADFYAHLFEGKYLDRQLRRLISSSARMDGLLNIGEKDFYKVTVPYPCDDEQGKIADFITSLNQKIGLAQQQIEQTQAYKQGLLQQMFV